MKTVSRLALAIAISAATPVALAATATEVLKLTAILLKRPILTH